MLLYFGLAAACSSWEFRVMRSLLHAAAILLLAVAAPPAFGQYGFDDRFELWAECSRFWPEVHVNQEQAVSEIDEEAVRIAVRSRLRSARLFEDPLSEDGSTWKPWEKGVWLIVDVHTVGAAFTTSVKLYKRRMDLFSGDQATDLAWEASSFGTYGGDEGYVLGVVGKNMDRFIDAYLRVNEPACKTGD